MLSFLQFLLTIMDCCAAILPFHCIFLWIDDYTFLVQVEHIATLDVPKTSSCLVLIVD